MVAGSAIADKSVFGSRAMKLIGAGDVIPEASRRVEAVVVTREIGPPRKFNFSRDGTPGSVR
jgi:hypothetical protein